MSKYDVWDELMNDYFLLGLSAKAAERWFHELTESDAAIRGLNNAELCTVIRWAVANPDQRLKYKPTLCDLRRWVYTKRKEDNHVPEYATTDDEIIKRVKAIIAQNKPPDRDVGDWAWSVVCGPHWLYHYDREINDLETEQVLAWVKARYQVDPEANALPLTAVMDGEETQRRDHVKVLEEYESYYEDQVI